MPARRGKLPRGWIPPEPKAPKAKPTTTPRAVVGQRDADGVPLMANGQPNPTGTGRYCPPAVCWCTGCAHWTPAPPINYASAVTRLQRAQAFLPPITEPED